MLHLSGDLEQKILSILYEHKKPLIPSEVLELVESKHKKLAYTTVMTVLQRLYKKGILDRENQGHAYAYFVKDKSEKPSLGLKSVFDELISSYGNLAISNFIDSVNTNPEHKKLLEEYIKNEKI